MTYRDHPSSIGVRHPEANLLVSVNRDPTPGTICWHMLDYRVPLKRCAALRCKSGVDPGPNPSAPRGGAVLSSARVGQVSSQLFLVACSRSTGRTSEYCIVSRARADFFDSLPRKRMAASMLLSNIEGAVLLVEPTYKEHWELPGGVVEADESPRSAAQREIAEELGLDYPVGRLLVLDWVPPASDRPEGLITIFDGGILSSMEVARIVVPPEELRGFGFFGLTELGSVLPPLQARRMVAAVHARRNGTTAYLEDGY